MSILNKLIKTDSTTEQVCSCNSSEILGRTARYNYREMNTICRN